MIEILLPVKMSFNIIEVENRMPSLKMSISYDYMNYSGSGEFWFTCDVCRDFLSKLQSVNRSVNSTAVLFDMENDFSVSVRTYNKLMRFSLTHKTFNKQVKVLFCCKMLIDEDSVAHLSRQFNDLLLFLQ